MSKEERTHGDEMASMGELHSLYKVKIMINKMINKLEAIVERDKQNVNERESKNAEWRRTIKKDR